MHGLFITGTDTGVGKTHLGSRLAATLAARGRRVRARKPVESGCPWVDGELLPQDARAYHDALGGAEPLQVICPWRLHAALSPERAAALEGVRYRLEDLVAACRRGVEAEDLLLVEGAGGFYSPIAPGALNADLAVALGLPVLLVAADRLGAIHQVLSTAEAIERRDLGLAAVVLNEVTPVADPLLDNAADLARWLSAPILRLPHGGAARAAEVLDALARLIG